MFLPIPFHSYFLKEFTKCDDDDDDDRSSVLQELDTWSDFNHYSKRPYDEADVSSTHDETEASSLLCDDPDESTQQSSSNVKEAERYTNYLDSESLAEPIRLLPFLSIRLQEQRDHSSSSNASTITVDDKDEKYTLNVNSNSNFEIWWGAEGKTSTLHDPPVSSMVEIVSATDFSSSEDDHWSSHQNTEHSSQDDDKATEHTNEESSSSGLYRTPAIPRMIEFSYDLDQKTGAIHGDSWLFDPVETLVLEKCPLSDQEDVHWIACSRLQDFITSHVMMRRPGTITRDEVDTVAKICATVEQYPQIAQVRYRVPLIRQEERIGHPNALKGEAFVSLPCYPLSIFCTTGHLQGVRVCYEAFPEAIGYADKLLGTALHYACYNGESVSVVQFLLDRFPEAARMTNRNYQSPLHVACSVRSSSLDSIRYSQLRIVELLLECYPTAARLVDENGYTPLHIACRAGAPVEVLAALLQSHAGVLQMSSRNLEKALHLAAIRSECSDTVRFLLRKDPSQAAAMDDKMQTPLHKACMAECVSTEIIYLLVHAYPHALTMRDDNIETPWEIATRLGNASTEILRLLNPQ